MRQRLWMTLVAAWAALACAAPSASAQPGDSLPGSVAGRGLDRTMRDFVADLGESSGFFPRRGDWRWVLTTLERDGRVTVGIQRIPAADTRDALDGFLSPWFWDGQLLYPPPDGPPIEHWRRVGTRFVPAARRRLPIFVEWRREHGRWVVSAVSAYDVREPHVAGRPFGEGEPATDRRGEPLRLPLPANARYAADQPWYVGNQPITIAGERLVKYGVPRRLADGDVVLWGTYAGVAVYIEPHVPFDRPEVVYVAVDATGLLQPYEDER